MSSAISTLTIMPTDRAGIDTYVNAVKNDILSGYINPLETAIMLKSFEEIVKALRADEDIKACIEREAEKYTEKTIEYAGVKISKSDRTTYDYSNCNDSVMSDLMMKSNQIDAELKGRMAWLKSLKTITPDINTGELINPPTTSTTSILSITLKK